MCAIRNNSPDKWLKMPILSVKDAIPRSRPRVLSYKVESDNANMPQQVLRCSEAVSSRPAPINSIHTVVPRRLTSNDGVKRVALPTSARRRCIDHSASPTLLLLSLASCIQHYSHADSSLDDALHCLCRNKPHGKVGPVQT
jgi:hypothetical protein